MVSSMDRDQGKASFSKFQKEAKVFYSYPIKKMSLSVMIVNPLSCQPVYCKLNYILV